MIPNTKVQIRNILMNNPVMPASGTFGIEMSNLVDFNKLGAMLPKSITFNPKEGNPPRRIMETPSGMLNAVGIQNKGIHHFLQHEIHEFEKFTSPLIISISGYSREEFIEMVKLLDAREGVDGIELNISCPNLAVGGESFGMDPVATYDILRAVRRYTDKAIIAKLTPNVGDITLIAKAAQEGGADSVSLINTVTAMAIDIRTRKPILGNITGGLSGPAIKPLAVRMVWEVANAVTIPVIGVGGIMNANDAIEFIIAGASAVQVGTANFVIPSIMEDIIQGIEKYMVDYNFGSIKELSGSIITGNSVNTCN